ncbi:MAG: WYL domain-containing protein [Proteobacteria bacterium]|nr:WYL domain-containing protein [Pseudomonadota bacterium]MCP4917407.1 WYL domain-containing protein [Pseudomonadota bacterium]
MSDDAAAPAPAATEGSQEGRRRRRRRRRRKDDGGGKGGGGRQDGRNDSGGRQEAQGPGVESPSSSRSGRRRKRRRRRQAAVAGLNRRRRLSRNELDDLEAYFSRMPDALLSQLYRGLGGQPSRVTETKRMVQLTVRAVGQGKRLGALLKGLHPKERAALAMLIQCGGLAHSEELLRELHLSLGGHDREWVKTIQVLADKGLVCATVEQDGQFFYLVPEPLVEFLVEHLADELAISVFKHDEIRVVNQRPFSPPLDFSVTTLCSYIDQRPPRMTQQQEIFKADKQEMDGFFAQLWEADSELFHFHTDFLIQHGLVELQGDRLAVNREVVEEWLQLDPQDQRDLVFRALDGRFKYAEWIMWAVHSGKGEWVAEQPMQALYRRWTRGEDWRKRFHKGDFAATRSHERESWSFAPLVNCGMLELGEWGQEKFYRLSQRALALLDPPENDGFTQFYLTPSFEIMAPAGIAPMLLFYIGELAELTGCDRANTYKITEVTIEQALHKGWKRDDVLDFLRDNSQIGLPENVEQTLKSWMGQSNDVEFHDCVLLTVHKSKIRALEATREMRPYLLHRFVPGMYAVDRNKLPEIYTILSEAGIRPSKEINRYPGAPEQAASRARLHELLADAREQSEDPQARAHAADTQPEDLHPVPGSGSGGRKKRKKKKDDIPRLSAREAKQQLDRAIALNQTMKVGYAAKDGKRVTYTLSPTRLALNAAGDQVVVAKNEQTGDLRTFKLARIERLKLVTK